MAKSHYAPGEGEFFKGYVPAVRQLAHITVGPATTADVVISATATYTLLNVPESPIVVFGIWTQTETAFTTNVTVDIGDSDSLTRFVSDTTINPAASGAVLIADTGLSVPYVQSAAQNLTVDINGAVAAAGLLHVYVDYAVLAD